MAAKDSKEQLKADTREEVYQAVLRAHATVVEAAPVADGDLRRSITVEEIEDGWIIASNLEHAEYMENGTGIFGPQKKPIRPKKAQALHWQDPVTGEDRFATEVAGVKPHHFFQKGALQFEQELKKIVGRSR